MKVLKDAAMPGPPGLPPFAPVSVQLLDILSREDAVVAQVAELLRMDAEFIGGVLRLSDTPLLGFEREIRAVAHAALCLGPRRLETLAATAGLRQPVAASGPIRGYWRHNVASGFLAAGFATARGMDPGPASVGILQESTVSYSPAAASHCAVPAETGPVDSLADVLGAVACSATDASGRQVACEALGQLPQSTWEAFRFDPARLSRAIEEILAVINN